MSLEEIKALYEKHKEFLFRYFLKLTQDEDFAYDIVQTIFLNLLKDSQEKRRTSIHLNFLIQIGYNAFLNEIKKKQNELNREKQFYFQNLEKNSVQYSLNEDSKDFFGIIKREILLLKLQERVKKSLLMRLFHEEKIEKIAQVLGVSKRTVIRDLELGLRELKKVLMEKGIYKDVEDI
ncbi:MAG: sigma-70 family RNA polymerase sigma factor [Leptospiraceae bacterium]|nr:sigma-70 family RNA polymerase sigma factor [Leptospiraceae bacterium]